MNVLTQYSITFGDFRTRVPWRGSQSQGSSTCNHTESAEVDPTWIIKDKIYQGSKWVDTEDIKNTIDLNPLLSIANGEGLSAQPRESRNWGKHHHFLFMTEISSHETLMNHICNQTFCLFFRDLDPWNRKGSMEHWYWNPISISCSYPPTEREGKKCAY